MSEVEVLHREAMRFAQQAVTARYRHDPEEAARAFEQAYSWEARAAAAIAADLAGEPSRSVLHRSAAALALECGALREAEKLICTALAGTPPDGIAQELRRLHDRVKMHLHYETQGLALSSNELLVRLTGPGVGPGIAPSDRVIPRISAAQTLILRTGERLRNLPFREKGRPRKAVRDECAFFLEVQPAASFGVALRLGGSSAQGSMPLGGTVEEVIDDTLHCLRLFNESADEALRAHIKSEPYLTNFVGLARELEPDGTDVEAVAFTAGRNGKLETVVLTGRPDRRALGSPTRKVDSGHEWVTLTGELVMAKKRESPGEGLIGLKDESGKTHDIVVEAGMADVVRSHWADIVTIAGYKIKGRVHLSELRDASDIEE